MKVPQDEDVSLGSEFVLMYYVWERELIKDIWIKKTLYYIK